LYFHDSFLSPRRLSEVDDVGTRAGFHVGLNFHPNHLLFKDLKALSEVDDVASRTGLHIGLNLHAAHLLPIPCSVIRHR
ncbi:MAG: hypothetical protein ACJ75H_19065, partial [Thermoanaerobaculia bacterium]